VVSLTLAADAGHLAPVRASTLDVEVLAPMKIAPWRLVLTGGAVLALVVAGVGLVNARSMAPLGHGTPSAGAAGLAVVPDGAAPALDAADLAALIVADPAVDQAADAPTAGALARLRQRFGQRVVHAAWVVDRGEKGIVERQLDHGTIASIGDGTIAISEAGNRSATVATDSATRVRRNGTAGTVGDLKAGDIVVVLSTVSGGTATANAIVVPVTRPLVAPAPTAAP
jgi:hypothetical protein